MSLTELTDEQKPICECLKPLGVLSLTELTDEQKPICERLKSWYVLFLTDFHRGTEAYLLTGEPTNVCKQTTDITERYRDF